MKLHVNKCLVRLSPPKSVIIAKADLGPGERLVI